MDSNILDFVAFRAKRMAQTETKRASQQPWKSMDDLPDVDSKFDIWEVLGG